jgi:hypothetical protein
VIPSILLVYIVSSYQRIMTKSKDGSMILQERILSLASAPLLVFEKSLQVGRNVPPAWKGSPAFDEFWRSLQTGSGIPRASNEKRLKPSNDGDDLLRHGD